MRKTMFAVGHLRSESDAFALGLDLLALPRKEPLSDKQRRTIEASLDAQDLNLSRGVVLPAYPVEES